MRVDLSPLIFVALAIAWAVYLVPKAMRHHEEVQRTRTVEKFSDSLRVLARREPVDPRSARLVVTDEARGTAPAAAAATPPSADAPDPAPDPAPALSPAGVAARRRRRVLSVIVLALAVVAGLAVAGVVSAWWVAAPALVLAAWLVACRVMVRRERGRRTAQQRHPVVVAKRLAARAARTAEASLEDDGPLTEDIPVVPAERPADGPVEVWAEVEVQVVDEVQPGLWEPVPMTLPTYVGKPAARRTVRTIELDETGVWTSGRTDADAALVREAEDAERAAKSAGESGSGSRAVGS